LRISADIEPVVVLEQGPGYKRVVISYRIPDMFPDVRFEQLVKQVKGMLSDIEMVKGVDNGSV
jgi:hypothetical protein